MFPAHHRVGGNIPRSMPRRRQEPVVHGRFRIERELARGGMGAVYAAFDESTGRRVALKRPNADRRAQMGLLFEREYHVLSGLRHPRIIEVYEYGVDAEGPYYTMELLEGADLRELAPADVPTACRYLRDVASSLALLHARRLLHRDVTPRNVRSTADGRCKLLDFGALAPFGVANDIVGTAVAMPPEALHGLPLDQRADLFSLGALSYWLLTKHQAYPVRRIAELPLAWRTLPEPPSAFSSAVPAALDQLVLSLLSQDPMARPVSAAEVIDRLTVIGQLEPERDVGTVLSYLVGTTLVERTQELAGVNQRIEHAKAQHGSSVFIDSGPGFGKTRLLGEIVVRAQLAGITALRADAGAQRRPFGMARGLVIQLIKLAPELAGKVLLPRGCIAQVCDEVRDLGGFVERSSHLAPASQFEIQAALNDAFLDATREIPLLIAVDNVDRSDTESAALLAGLARAAGETRLLVVATATTRVTGNYPSPVAVLRDASVALRLGPLEVSGTYELVRSAFGDVPHVTRMAHRLHDATDGNPQHCLDLVQDLISSGTVQYADGAWVLPLELPSGALPARGEEALMERLLRCRGSAQRLAEAMSVASSPMTLSHLQRLAGETLDRRALFSELEELVLAGVLVDDTESYRFRQEAFRIVLLETMPRDRRVQLNKRLADALLELHPDDGDVKFQAALHLIQGGEETRGADLVADLASQILASDGDSRTALIKSVAPLEAALDVYRREDRSSLELLTLLVPLVVASYLCDRRLALRYGDETLRRLEEAIGQGLAKRSRRLLGDKGSLLLALGVAAAKHRLRRRSAREPDFATVLKWLFRTVMTLTSIAVLVIDHDEAVRLAAILEPFRALGRKDPAAVCHECCEILVMMTEDRMAEAHRRWTDLLARLHTVPLEPAAAIQLHTGALYALGVLESQRDDDSALFRLKQIEALGGYDAEAIANQLRFLYHGFRGEIGLALKAREKVELYALHQGTAWQVEIWSTSTMSAVYRQTRDGAGHKSILELLERLKDEIPSLTLYWQRARGTQFLVRGEPARAIEAYEESLRGLSPRELIGWAFIRGGLAMAYNELGQHATAKRVCEETIHLFAEDREYVALNLNVYVELCLAEAGLGDFVAARELFDDLFERHAPRQNPLTLGSLHKARAQVALLEGDWPVFEEHAAAMERWFRWTKNPALIVQCEELRNAAKFSRGPGPERGASSEPRAARARGTREDECQNRALELVAGRAGAREAYFFAEDVDGKPRLACQLGSAPVSAELLVQVSELFDERSSNREDTRCTEVDSVDFSALDAGPAARDYRLLPLRAPSGSELKLVGAIAMPAGAAISEVPNHLLDDLAHDLYNNRLDAEDSIPTLLMG
jgi:tetratricopeptide (TPR) repeat protein